MHSGGARVERPGVRQLPKSSEELGGFGDSLLSVRVAELRAAYWPTKELKVSTGSESDVTGKE